MVLPSDVTNPPVCHLSWLSAADGYGRAYVRLPTRDTAGANANDVWTTQILFVRTRTQPSERGTRSLVAF